MFVYAKIDIRDEAVKGERLEIRKAYKDKYLVKGTTTKSTFFVSLEEVTKPYK